MLTKYAVGNVSRLVSIPGHILFTFIPFGLPYLCFPQPGNNFDKKVVMRSRFPLVSIPPNVFGDYFSIVAQYIYIVKHII